MALDDAELIYTDSAVRERCRAERRHRTLFCPIKSRQVTWRDLTPALCSCPARRHARAKKSHTRPCCRAVYELQREGLSASCQNAVMEHLH